MTKPTVSIVVLNWNGKRYVDGFMSGVLGQTYSKELLEIVFTDNDSSDDSVDYFMDNYGKNSNVKIVKNDANHGYSKGNNLGIKQATGDYVLICNNDLELDKKLVENLVDSAISNSADLVVPKLMFLNKKGYINNAGSSLSPNNEWPVQEIGYDQKDIGQYDKTVEISAFCGACVLIKRSFLREIGLFDNKFFMYFEDVDLSWRGQKKGAKYIYEPTAIAHHAHTGSSKEGSTLFNHFVGRNRMLVLIKNAPIVTILKGTRSTLRDHLILRLKNLVKALLGRYSKKQALREFYFSQKMLFSILALTPYVILKRLKIIKEEKIENNSNI